MGFWRRLEGSIFWENGILAARANFKPSPTRNIWAAPFACWFSRDRVRLLLHAEFRDGEIRPAWMIVMQTFVAYGTKGCKQVGRGNA